MPSYLSSTQTVGPEPLQDLRGVLGGRGEHELQRVEEGQLGAVEAALACQLRRPADVAGEHPGPLHRVERAVESLRQRRLDQPLAEPDAKLAGEDANDAAGGLRVGAGEEACEQIGLPRRPGGSLDGRERRSDILEARRPGLVGRVSGACQDVRDRGADVREAVVGSAQVAAARSADLGEGVRDRGPADAGRPLVRLGEGPAGQEDDGDRQLLLVEGSEIVREERGLLRRAGGGGDSLGELAPAPHAGMVYLPP